MLEKFCRFSFCFAGLNGLFFFTNRDQNEKKNNKTFVKFAIILVLVY